MVKLTRVFFIILSLYFLAVSFADAQVQIDEPPWQGLVPCGRITGTDAEIAPCTLCHFILGFQRLVQYGLYMATTVAFVGIFFAGIMYAISSGSSDMTTKAKKFLTGTLTGFAIVLGAWFIINITLWAIAANDNLGITRAKSWWQFTCSTRAPIVNINPEDVLGGEGVSGDVFESDEAARAFLTGNGNGVTINKSACSTEQQTDCTDLKGLPKKTANLIVAIKKDCRCEIMITGGTEAGHKTHGEGKPIVDLRWDDGSAKFILDNRSKLEIKKALCPEIKNPMYGCTGYEPKSVAPHLHLEFYNL